MRTEGKTVEAVSRLEMDQAAAAYLKGLVAADYSPSTVRAALSDLDQFIDFLAGRGIERVKNIRRSDILAAEDLRIISQYRGQGDAQLSVGRARGEGPVLHRLSLCAEQSRTRGLEKGCAETPHRGSPPAVSGGVPAGARSPPQHVGLPLLS